MYYECPGCGNVSTEGLSITGGPECARCGVRMAAKSGDPERGRGSRRSRRRRPTPPEPLRA